MMTPAPLIRWSGLAAMLGGALWIALWFILRSTWSADLLTLTYEDYNRLMPIPLLLLMSGLAGLYARQGGRSGKLGTAGAVVAFIGLVMLLAGSVVEFWIGGGIRHGNESISQSGWGIFLLGFPVLAVGMLLFGIAALRAKVLPGWRRPLPLIIGLMITSGMLLAFGIIGEAGLAISVFSFGLGWIVLGYGLWSDGSEQKVA